MPIMKNTNAVVIGSHIIKIIENSFMKNNDIREKIVEDINAEVKNLSSAMK